MAEKVKPEVEEEIRQAFDKLCAEINSADMVALRDRSRLGIYYDFVYDRLAILTPEQIVMSMEPWALSAFAYLIKYILQAFPKGEIEDVLADFVQLYLRVFHAMLRMTWLMKQEGKTRSEIASFMQVALPEIWVEPKIGLTSDEIIFLIGKGMGWL